MISQGSEFLVLGGSGQLGTALVTQLSSAGATVHAPGRAALDLTRDDVAATVRRLRPRAVLNASAYNDVVAAENEPERSDAFALNRSMPELVARTCADLAIAFVHVSTDYVFDGQKRTPYVEDDPPAPLQAYGESKLAGERAVLDAYPHAVVVRTSTVYGRGSRQGSNYVDAIAAQARKSDHLEVVRPPVSSPTLSWDLASALLALLEADASGIVHFANAGGCSRYELAQETIRLIGRAGEVTLGERSADAGGLLRPAYSVFDTSRYRSITGLEPRRWEVALADYLTRSGP